jgi:hypothetical protein
VAAAGATDAGRHLVADQLAAAVGENWRTVGQACSLLLAVAGGKSPGAALVCRDARENRNAAGTGGIGWIVALSTKSP